MALRAIYIILILIPDFIFAQEYPSEIFHKGKVVLESKDTLEGQIRYDLKNDLIQIILGNTVQTYSARKLLTFTIFDETTNAYRTFYSIPYERESNYKVPMLFEVLYEGKLTLLARESIVNETVPQYSYYYRGSYNITRTRLDYEYFFIDRKGKFIKYNEKKQDIYYIMKDKEPQIKQYIKKNKLKLDLRRDLIRITSYYNSLIGG